MQGAWLMIAFCCGLGIPIVVVAVGAIDLRNRFGFFKRHHTAIELITGLLLVTIGFLMITNLFARLAGALPVII